MVKHDKNDDGHAARMDESSGKPGVKNNFTRTHYFSKSTKNVSITQKVHKESAAAVKLPSRNTTAMERRDIRMLLRGSIYEGMVDVRYSSNEEYSSAQIIEFCLDIGEMMLIAGADGRSVEIALVAIAASWNLGSVELDFPGSSILMIYAPPFARSQSGMRVVRSDSTNLHKLNHIYSVVDGIVSGEYDMTKATQRLEEIDTAPPPWSTWVPCSAMGVLGITVAFEGGGTIRSAIGAFFLMFAMVLIMRRLSNMAIPAFYSVAVQSLCAMLAGSVSIYYGILSASAAASMVSACMVLILPHPAIVACAQDAIGGFRSMALSRGVGIGLVILGLIVGLQASLAVSDALHSSVKPETIHLSELSLAMALLATVVAALANAVAQASAAKNLFTIGSVALVTQLAQQLCLHAKFGAHLSAMIGAAVLGSMSTWIAARSRISVASLVVPAFCGALLPSLAVAHALLRVTSHEPGAFTEFTLKLLSTMSIGAGLVLGNLLVSGEARKAAFKTRVRSINRNTAPHLVEDPLEITSELPVITENALV